MDTTEHHTPSEASWRLADGAANGSPGAPIGPQARPGEDPAAAWERYKLLVAVHDREVDLADARRDFHAALDEKARLALRGDILREAVKDRETDLAQARSELYAALDQTARVTLERDLLRVALSERDANVVKLQEIARRHGDDTARLALKLQLLEEGSTERVLDEGMASVRPNDGPPKRRGRLAERFDDLIFFIKYMVNAPKH